MMKRTSLDSKISQIDALINYSIYALNVHRHPGFIKHALEAAKMLVDKLLTPEKSRKAHRNISNDKRKNLKRKFRVERNCYPYHHTDLEKDLLMVRQLDVEFGDPVYANVGCRKYANIPVTFEPKPLPE